MNDEAVKSRPSILCVEDDVLTQTLYKRILAAYDVDVVSDTTEALQMARHTPYAVILIDIQLGQGMNGLELCQEIRSMEGYAHTPIAAITALWQTAPDSILKAGFSHFLSKPFDRFELDSLVAGLLLLAENNA